MAEHKDMERVPDYYENEAPSEVFDVVDIPQHEDGDEEAPRDSNLGDLNTRDEDRDHEVPQDESRDKDQAEADREGA